MLERYDKIRDVTTLPAIAASKPKPEPVSWSPAVHPFGESCCVWLRYNSSSMPRQPPVKIQRRRPLKVTAGPAEQAGVEIE
jgi:hypothetical protein